MAVSPFIDRALDYDAWFDRYPFVYEAELRALRALLPCGRGMEVGVGSGRFAAPLRVGMGIDPCLPMLAMAKERGLQVACGRAESLPVRCGALDYLLLVTVLCFFAEPHLALREARRVLRKGGSLIIAFIDSQSFLGQEYEAKQTESVFYQDARFYSVDEVLSLCRQAGFSEFSLLQTLFKPLGEVGPNEPVQAGWGQGGVVVLAAS